MSTVKNKYPYGYMETSASNLLDGSGNYIGNEFNIPSSVNCCFLDLLSTEVERTYKLQKYEGGGFVDEATLLPGEEVFVEISAGSLLRFVVENGVGGDVFYSYAVGLRNDLDDHSSSSTQGLETSSSESSSSLEFTVSSDSSSSSVFIDLDIENIVAEGGLEFGEGGGVSEKYIAIGVPTYDMPFGETIISNTGAIYIYKKKDSVDNEWGNPFLIEPPEVRTDMKFGTNVALNDNYCIVSSLNDESVYMYSRSRENTWSQILVFESSQDNPKLAISEDDFLIGEDLYNSSEGRVRVFRKVSPTSWTYSATLTAVSGASNDQFGYSVDIDGDYAVVGTPYADISGYTSEGSVWAFNKLGPSSWDIGFEIVASDKMDNHNYGKKVKISGNFMGVLAEGNFFRDFYSEKRNTSLGNVWDSETVISSNIIHSSVMSESLLNASSVFDQRTYAGTFAVRHVNYIAYRYYDGSWQNGAFSSSANFSASCISSIITSDGHPAAVVGYTSSVFFYRTANIDGSGGSFDVSTNTGLTLPTSISLALMGTLPAVAEITSAGQVKYVRANHLAGTSWGTPYTVTTSSNPYSVSLIERTGGSPSIFLVSGTVVYHRYTNNSTGIGTWSNVSVASGVTVSRLSACLVSGNPAIIYASSSNIYYKRASDSGGTTWPSAITIATNGNSSYQSLDLKVIDGVPVATYIDSDNKIGFISSGNATGSSWLSAIQSSPEISPSAYSSLSITVFDGRQAVVSSDSTGVYFTGKYANYVEEKNPSLSSGYCNDNVFYFKNTSGNDWEQVSSLLQGQNIFGSKGYRFGFNKDANSIDMHLITGEQQFSSDESSSTEVLISSYSSTSSAPDFGDVETLYEASDDLAGRSMAADGNYFVAGGDEAAYAFYRDPVTKIWSSVSILTAYDGVAGDGFGTSVSINNGYILVGAPNKSSNTGAVYSFRNSGGNNWGVATKISSPAGAGDYFGENVDNYGSYVAVSARLDNNVYTFVRVGLNSYSSGTGLLSAIPLGFTSNSIGYAVKFIDSSTLACGKGSMKIFKRTGTTTWEFGYLIEENESEFASDLDGSSGKYLAVSNGNGDVDIFINLNKSHDMMGLDTVSEIQSGEEFGYSVGVDGLDLICSAGEYNNSEYSRTASGAFYVYRKSGLNTWNLFNRKELSFPIDNDNFGDVVAVYGGTMFTRALRNSSDRKIYYVDYTEENSSSSSSSSDMSLSGSSSSAVSDSFDTTITTVGVGPSSAPDIALVGGNPAIVYRQSTTIDIVYSRASDSTGSTWGALVVANSNSDSVFTKMIILSDGKPCIFYRDGNYPYSVSSADSTGSSWGTPVSIAILSPLGSWDAAVNPSSNYADVVLYMQDGPRTIFYYGANAVVPSSWNFRSSFVTGDAVNDIHLDFTSSGKPIVVWSDTVSDEIMFSKNSAVDGSGTWDTQTVASVSASTYCGMKVIGDGPSIAFSDNNDLYYIHSSDEGSTWEDPEFVFGSSLARDYIKLDSIGTTPVISFKCSNYLGVAVRIGAGNWAVYRLNGNNTVYYNSIVSFGDAVGIVSVSAEDGALSYSYLNLT